MNDSPVDCQNREWTEPQRDVTPAVFIKSHRSPARIPLLIPIFNVYNIIYYKIL